MHTPLGSCSPLESFCLRWRGARLRSLTTRAARDRRGSRRELRALETSIYHWTGMAATMSSTTSSMSGTGRAAIGLSSKPPSRLAPLGACLVPISCSMTPSTPRVLAAGRAVYGNAVRALAPGQLLLQAPLAGDFRGRRENSAVVRRTLRSVAYRSHAEGSQTFVHHCSPLELSRLDACHDMSASDQHPLTTAPCQCGARELAVNAAAHRAPRMESVSVSGSRQCLRDVRPMQTGEHCDAIDVAHEEEEPWSKRSAEIRTR
jgi:hypothetical protein